MDGPGEHYVKWKQTVLIWACRNGKEVYFIIKHNYGLYDRTLGHKRGEKFLPVKVNVVIGLQKTLCISLVEGSLFKGHVISDNGGFPGIWGKADEGT